MSTTIVETFDQKVLGEGSGSNGGPTTSTTITAAAANASTNGASQSDQQPNNATVVTEAVTDTRIPCLQSLKACCKKNVNFGLDDLFWLLFLVMIIVFSVIKSTTHIAWSALLYQALTVLLILIVLYWVATAFNKFVLEDSSTAHWNAHARFTAAATETRIKEEQDQRVHVIAPPKMGGAKLNIIYTVGDVPLVQPYRGIHHHHNRHSSSGSLVLGGGGGHGTATAPTTSCSSTATSTPIASGKLVQHTKADHSPTALLKGLTSQLAPIQIAPTPSAPAAVVVSADIESGPLTPLSIVQDEHVQQQQSQQQQSQQQQQPQTTPQPSSAHLPDTIQEEAETPVESPCDSAQNTLTERPTASHR